MNENVLVLRHISILEKRVCFLDNMKFSEINDPNGICKDITGLGRWGNGDVELFMEHQDELDQIMEIVKQSFDVVLQIK